MSPGVASVLAVTGFVLLAIIILNLSNALVEWLQAVAYHRKAQGNSVLRHAGLLQLDEDEVEEDDATR